jgi:hypothetical protein
MSEPQLDLHTNAAARPEGVYRTVKPASSMVVSGSVSTPYRSIAIWLGVAGATGEALMASQMRWLVPCTGGNRRGGPRGDVAAGWRVKHGKAGWVGGCDHDAPYKFCLISTMQLCAVNNLHQTNQSYCSRVTRKRTQLDPPPTS